MKIPTLSNISEYISSFYHSYFGVRELAETKNALLTWFSSPLGKALFQSEKDVMDVLLPEIYGYHLMQLSVLDDNTLGEQCPITHHFSLSPNAGKVAQARAIFEQLPIQEESIDAAILHHSLEFSTRPHQLLAETARTIMPNGYIVVIGFNPWGLLQIRKWLGRYLLRNPHWRYHRLFRSRLIDWLQVLDFDVIYKKNYGYELPVHRNTPQWLKKALSIIAPFSGSFYVLVARKTRTPMTMIKTPWKRKNRLSQWVKQPVISRGSVQSTPLSDGHNEYKMNEKN